MNLGQNTKCPALKGGMKCLKVNAFLYSYIILLKRNNFAWILVLQNASQFLMGHSIVIFQGNPIKEIEKYLNITHIIIHISFYNSFTANAKASGFTPLSHKLTKINRV